MCADLKVCRADQISYIFNHYQIQILERQGRQRVSEHDRVQVTFAACVDLNRWQTGSDCLLGINGSGEVALDHTELQTSVQRLEHFEDKTRLARPGGSHNIDRIRTKLVQHLTITIRDAIISRQYMFND